MSKNVSIEGLSALYSVEAGDAYLKAHHGASRAGRTNSLRTLMARELIETNPHGYGFVLTDAGKQVANANRGAHSAGGNDRG